MGGKIWKNEKVETLVRYKCLGNGAEHTKKSIQKSVIFVSNLYWLFGKNFKLKK